MSNVSRIRPMLQGLDTPFDQGIGARYRMQRVLRPGSRDRAVYLAQCVETGASVELTVLSGDLGRDDELAAALSAHVALMRSISSVPGLSSWQECRRVDGSTIVLVAEHPAGVTLREVIDGEGPLGPQRAIGLAIQIAEALERVHGMGLVHGGLGPDNVVVTAPPETVVLTQVGIDWLIWQSASDRLVRGNGSVDGAYRAPEQESGTATERSDVYAVGATLYEMLAGEPPPGAGRRNGRRGVIALRGRRPEITPGLERTIMRALDPVPEVRQSDASTLCNDLWQESRSSARRPFLEATRLSRAIRAHGVKLDTWPRRLVALGALAEMVALTAWLAYPRTPASLPAGRHVPAAPAAIQTQAAPQAATPPASGPETRRARPSTPAPRARETPVRDPSASPARLPLLNGSSPAASPNSARVEGRPPERSARQPAASGVDVPRSSPPSVVHLPPPSASPERSRLERRPPGGEAGDDPTAIIDWLLSEGARQRP